MAVEVIEDRKLLNRQTEDGLVRVAAGLAATPALALAIIVGVATRNVLIALLVLVVVAGAVGYWAWSTVTGFGRRVVDRPGSFELTEADQPRLHNLVEGLCVTNGFAKPAMIGVDGPGRNMAAVTVGWGSSSTNALIVSVPLLDSLSRIELEGAVAQELSRFLDGSSSLATLVAALRSTPPFGTIFAGRLDAATVPDEQLLADLTGVRMTRYPPGLASALDTVAGGSTEIGTAEAATAGLWLADPLPAGASVETPDGVASLEVRAATLRELSTRPHAAGRGPVSRRPVLVVLAVLAVATLAAACSSAEPDAAGPSSTGAAEPTTTTTAAPPPTFPLSGTPIDDPAKAERRALVVKIDNVDQYARPQSGINQADIVYEEKIEGPISRFAAIFHSQDVPELGPVRSGRSTDVAIVTPLNTPLYAFSGANAVFIEQLRAAPLIDIGYDVQPDSYDRKPGRTAPDNLFTSTERLWALAPVGASPPGPQLIYRAPGATTAPSAVPAASFTYSFGGGPVGQPVTMTWDPAVSGWARIQKGSPHVDTDGVQIAPPNVIVQFVPYRDTGLVDTSNTPVPEALLVGTGTAWVFTAGTATSVTWSKPTEDAVTAYTAADGTPVGLTPGQTWIALVPTDGEFTGVRADGTPLVAPAG